VVEVAPSGDRIIAMADNLMVARAAFDTAVALWPDSPIELRQRARGVSNNKKPAGQGNPWLRRRGGGMSAHPFLTQLRSSLLAPLPNSAFCRPTTSGLTIQAR